MGRFGSGKIHRCPRDVQLNRNLRMFMCVQCSFTQIPFFRRIHVSGTTLKYLNGEYEVVASDGAEKNKYLRDNHVSTYYVTSGSRRERSTRRTYSQRRVNSKNHASFRNSSNSAAGRNGGAAIRNKYIAYDVSTRLLKAHLTVVIAD